MRQGLRQDVPHWAAELQTGGGLAGHVPEPTRLEWKTWGQASMVQNVDFVDAEQTPEWDVPQLVQAVFIRPLAWTVGFWLNQSDANPGSYDELTVKFRVQYGIGMAMFVQFKEFRISERTGEQPQQLVERFGPIPAESIIVSAHCTAHAGIGTSFPHTRQFQCGAWAAPQVW